jgi:hypothetical protein
VSLVGGGLIILITFFTSYSHVDLFGIQLRVNQQLESEIVLLKESNARLARFEQELLSCSTPAPSTGDSSPT